MSKMRKTRIHVVVNHEDIMEAAFRVASIAGVEFIDSEAGRQTGWHSLAEKLSDQTARLSEMLTILGLSEPEAQLPARVAPAQDAGHVDRLLQDCESDIRQGQQNEAQLDARIRRSRKILEYRRRLKELDITSKQIQALSYLDLQWGWIPAAQYRRLALPCLQTPILFLPFYKENERFFILAAAERDHGHILKRLLKAVFYEPLDTGSEAQNSGEMPADPEKELMDLKARRQEHEAAKSRLAAQFGEAIASILPRLRGDLNAVRIADGSAARSGEMAVMRASAPAEKAGQVVQTVKESTKNPYWVIVTAEET